MRKRFAAMWMAATVICAVFALMLVCPNMTGVVASAAAEEEEVLSDSSDASGISIRTSADKKNYKEGGVATIKVSVTNKNDYDMSNVQVDYTLPQKYSVTAGQLSQTVDSLAAGETKEFSVSATVVGNPNADIVISSYFTPPVIVLIVVLAVAIILLVIFLVRKSAIASKIAKKGASVFVILALLGGILSAGAVPTTESQAKTADGLVENEDYRRVSVHDPSIVKDPKTGTYYVFGSHRAFAKSKDLLHWETFQNNVCTDFNELFKEPWAYAKAATPKGNLSGYMWAPDVIWNDTMKKWCMYMSIDGDNWCSSICLLTADDIEGPYEYKGIVVYSGMNNPKTPPDLSKTDVYKVLGEDEDLSRYSNTSNACINAIDPSVKYDENGDLYMSYGSWSAGIYMLKLDKNTGLRDYETTYPTKLDESDAYFGYKIAGGHYNSGEASYLMKAGDYWYLFMSYAGLSAIEGYQIRIYRSKNIQGPYVDQNGESPICKRSQDMKKTNLGVKIFGSYDMSGLDKVQVAQGHNSAFVDDDGKIYLVYHTRFQSVTGHVETHQVRVHQMFVNEDGWLIAAPYEYSGETLPKESYSADEVSGTYDFIYHEPTSSYNVVNGEQYGIVGAEEETTQEVELQKDLAVNHRLSSVKIKVSYSHKGSAKVKIKPDGTVTGDYSGTWKFTNGANVEMVLNGVTYKGVFLKQQDESTERKMRMTFSMLGDNVTVWGVASDGDNEEKTEE